MYFCLASKSPGTYLQWSELIAAGCSIIALYSETMKQFWLFSTKHIWCMCMWDIRCWIPVQPFSAVPSLVPIFSQPVSCLGLMEWRSCYSQPCWVLCLAPLLWVFAGARGGLAPFLKTGIAMLNAVITLTCLTESLGMVLFIVLPVIGTGNGNKGHSAYYLTLLKYT